MQMPSLRSRNSPSSFPALLALTVLLSVSFTVKISAQSGQRYGAQLAVLTTSIGLGPTASATGGLGLEPQFRVNSLLSSEDLGTLSLGIGGQWTRHSGDDQKLSITGVFLEPRWVFVTPSTRMFPYLSARLAALRQASNFGTASGGTALGGGAGLAMKLSRSTNLDLGAALVRQTFGDFTFTRGGREPGTFEPFFTYAIKFGVNVGFPRGQ